MSFIVVIRGSLACGKTTISKKLSEIIKAKYISIDEILETKGLDNDWQEGYISEKSFIKANETILPSAKKILGKGKPIIFDGNFYWKSQLDDLIKKLNFPHYIFTLKAPLKVCIERDAKRTKPHGEDAAKAVFKKSNEFDYGILIDVTKNLRSCLDEIISYLPK